MKRGFTLIELLIVVAIIAILAAIAVPNFLEAQVRSKVARSMADMRSISLALESYKIDNNLYPPYSFVGGGAMKFHQRLNRLSTPIAYLSAVPDDPFSASSQFIDPVNWDYHHNAYLYHPLSLKSGAPNWGTAYWFNECRNRGECWMLSGRGPNCIFDAYYTTNVHPMTNTMFGVNADVRYDPTNGTVSLGDLDRTGP